MLGREGEQEGEKEASSLPGAWRSLILLESPSPQCLQRGHFLPYPLRHPCMAPRALRVKPSLHRPASSPVV